MTSNWLMRARALPSWALPGLGVSVLIAVFVGIAREMREGETSAFDNAILNAFRDAQDPTAVVGPAWLHEAARDVTSLGSYVVLGILVALVVIYLWIAGKRLEAQFVTLAIVTGVVLSNLLKIGFNRPRPSFDNTPEVFSASFPSGHATMSAVVFLTLGAMLASHESRRSLRVVYLATAVVLTLLVGVSRVYLGVHYPTDVIAGWSLGIAWAICWALIIAWVRARRAIAG